MAETFTPAPVADWKLALLLVVHGYGAPLLVNADAAPLLASAGVTPPTAAPGAAIATVTVAAANRHDRTSFAITRSPPNRRDVGSLAGSKTLLLAS
ncbi:MAG: hypothetical protein ACYCVZ_08830 [Streptosporangiaceae bacterium]